MFDFDENFKNNMWNIILELRSINNTRSVIDFISMMVILMLFIAVTI